MAGYFQTVRLDSATAEVGIAPLHRGAAIRQAHLVPVSRLFGWTDSGKHEEREYSTSWALFTFLINQHRDELLRYMQLLQREGKSRNKLTMEDSTRLWAASFPTLPLGDVDAAMRQWLLIGRHTILRFNVQRNHWPVAERELGNADVYAVHGYLHLMSSSKRKGRAHVAAALEADPSNVVANMLAIMWLGKKLTIEQSRTIAAAHPGDFRAWLLLADAIEQENGDPAELEATHAQACSLIAHNPALLAPKELCEPPVAEHRSNRPTASTTPGRRGDRAGVAVRPRGRR
jgi:hypothetical protein